MEFLWEGLLSITWQQAVMYLVGGALIWLAIKKNYEPALLLPLGFIASIVGFRSDRNRGLAVAGIVISAIGVLMKVMLILSEAALLPDWFTNGIW